ncbi:hypothetical protein J1605_013487 [Eschrichtius robustus]|uniref:Uncharacterized protein n=1 Tax=Eschrichtius robustus TaxID=9764 RepID=A0AB34GF16_ESCRO|nr:hypothetical protein J1605_013487 [Eschrichtius robustus]
MTPRVAHCHNRREAPGAPRTVLESAGLRGREDAPRSGHREPRLLNADLGRTHKSRSVRSEHDGRSPRGKPGPPGRAPQVGTRLRIPSPSDSVEFPERPPRRVGGARSEPSQSEAALLPGSAPDQSHPRGREAGRRNRRACAGAVQAGLCRCSARGVSADVPLPPPDTL